MKSSYRTLLCGLFFISTLQYSFAAEHWSEPSYTSDWSKDYIVPQ